MRKIKVSFKAAYVEVVAEQEIKLHNKLIYTTEQVTTQNTLLKAEVNGLRHAPMNRSAVGVASSSVQDSELVITSCSTLFSPEDLSC